jgi:hypothetical protein
MGMEGKDESFGKNGKLGKSSVFSFQLKIIDNLDALAGLAYLAALDAQMGWWGSVGKMGKMGILRILIHVGRMGKRRFWGILVFSWEFRLYNVRVGEDNVRVMLALC